MGSRRWKKPIFGQLLDWRVITPRREHTTTYNNREYRMEWNSTRNMRARFGHGSGGWMLDVSEEWAGDRNDPDMPWWYGYPLNGDVATARTNAELRIICPNVTPTGWEGPDGDHLSDAPPIHRVMRYGACGDSLHGLTTCRSSYDRDSGWQISISRYGRTLATVWPDITIHNKPATTPITVTWDVHRDGTVAAMPTWPAAYREATR